MLPSDTITRVTLGERVITLLGTAHVSRESTEEVKRVIHDEQPDHVCVEIDSQRYKTLKEGQDWSKMKINDVLRQRRGFLLLANLVLTSFQRKLGKQLGTVPGDEMKAGVAAAEEAGIPFTLADREVQTTLRRAWAHSSWWNKLKMLSSLLASIFSNEELSEEDIENLKRKSALDDMMDELAAFLPSVKEVLIDERDRYLATKIYQAEGQHVLAVIGAGHAPGIVRWLQALHQGTAPTKLDDITQVPKATKLSKILPWIIPTIVIGLLAAGFIRSGWDQGLQMFLYWVVVNGTLSAIGALIALAHPLTIILSFLAAPFTSLNPTIGVGIVTGLFEAYIRRPRVSDFENLTEDILTVRGFFRNRFTHALVVFFLSSIGSAAGTFIAFPFLLSLLA
ncbi:MAG: TraB/GumN family protein, partial [Spirochaetia bacterium]|nr:TraB/GumN family protein [Spirochaetia bacterium]